MTDSGGSRVVGDGKIIGLLVRDSNEVFGSDGGK